MPHRAYAINTFYWCPKRLISRCKRKLQSQAIWNGSSIYAMRTRSSIYWLTEANTTKNWSRSKMYLGSLDLFTFETTTATINNDTKFTIVRGFLFQYFLLWWIFRRIDSIFLLLFLLQVTNPFKIGRYSASGADRDIFIACIHRLKHWCCFLNLCSHKFNNRFKSCWWFSILIIHWSVTIKRLVLRATLPNDSSLMSLW